jgi:hypothetical protein
MKWRDSAAQRSAAQGLKRPPTQWAGGCEEGLRRSNWVRVGTSSQGTEEGVGLAAWALGYFVTHGRKCPQYFWRVLAPVQCY